MTQPSAPTNTVAGNRIPSESIITGTHKFVYTPNALNRIHVWSMILFVLEVPIGIRNFKIQKLSENRFGIRTDNSWFSRTISDKDTIQLFQKIPVNFVLVVLPMLIQYMKQWITQKMDLVIPTVLLLIVNVWTIYGNTLTSDIFWTEICQTSRTSDGLGQIFFWNWHQIRKQRRIEMLRTSISFHVAFA